MCEIKFRKLKENDVFSSNKMDYNPVLECSTGMATMAVDINWLMKKYQSNLMQYTGLKDKNGTEIYEGDVVQFDGNYEVRFGEHGVPSLEDEEYVDLANGFYLKAQHDLKNVEPFGLDIPLNKTYALHCKVIGNVFDDWEKTKNEQR